MNKLEQLIKELCPEGVEYIEVGKVCNTSTGDQLNKTTLKDEGEFPVYNGGIYPSGYHEKHNSEMNSIAISQGGASAGFVNWVDVPFWAGAHCYVVKNIEKNVINRYLYFFLKSKQEEIQNSKHGAGIPGLNSIKIKSLLIPIPPLPVQAEIVRILDNFTQLTAELTAELTARRKQYEYYRDNLLTFDKSVAIKRICEVCEVFTGGEPPGDCIKGDTKDEMHPYPVWGNGKDIYGYAGSYKIDKDAVVISSIGANTGTVYFHEAFFTPIIRLKVIMPKSADLNMRYLYHALSTMKITSKSSSVPNMNANEIKNLQISFPPLAEQQRIVDILDRFDKLCNDISEGLPAEIEARRIQYEYYRDKLLTFNP